MYSSVYYQYGFYTNTDNTIRMYVDRDVSKTYPFGNIGTFTTLYNTRTQMKFDFMENGSLYQNDSGTITVTHYNAGSTTTRTMSVNQYLPQYVFWFIVD